MSFFDTHFTFIDLYSYLSREADGFASLDIIKSEEQLVSKADILRYEVSCQPYPWGHLVIFVYI